MWALKNETSYHQLKTFVSQMSSFLELYTWLSDSFMLEFFTEDHWKKLPQTWQNALDNLDLSELADWLSPRENIVENPDQPVGYPLSSFVQSLANSSLSYQAREVACHAIEMYRTRLKQNATKLKIHCYRAALEVVITKHYPNMKRCGLRSVKKAETMTFKQYSELATEKLGIHLPEADLTSSTVENLLHHWKEVIIFYSLRLLLAPVIETMLLMDRLLFLYENGK